MLVVYALRSLRDGGLYIGLTRDLGRRFKEHSAGCQRPTRARVPFEIIFVEEASTLKEARAREKYLKSGAGREFLRAIVAER